MRKAASFVALALVVGLAGCRDPGIDGTTASRDDQPTPAPLESGPTAQGLERVLPGGIDQLPFPFHLNLDRDTGAVRQGNPVREVGIELLGPGPMEAESEFSALVAQQGGSVEQRRETGHSLRIVYALADGTKMLAWFRTNAPSGERYALQRQDATGTLYLAWPYIDKDA